MGGEGRTDHRPSLLQRETCRGQHRPTSAQRTQTLVCMRTYSITCATHINSSTIMYGACAPTPDGLRTHPNQERVLVCTHSIPKGIYCKRVAPSSTISVESAPPFTAASEILGCYTANDPKWAKNSVLNRTEQKTIRISMNRKQRSEF